MNYRNWIEKRMKDISKDERIIFALQCECCAQTYRTFPVQVDTFLESVSEAKTAAYQQALDDFSQILSHCPKCGRFVCERCMVIDIRGHLCKDCSEETAGGASYK